MTDEPHAPARGRSAPHEPPNFNILWASLLFDVAYAAGIRHVAICPGSRSAPLAIAAASQDRIRVTVHHDERSAAFFALGVARGSGAPAAVLSTSGTAAANFHPAVLEASHAMDPLLVLTADRPEELQDCGAPQTIAQRHLYGGAVRAFLTIPPPDATVQTMRAAVRAAAEACSALTAVPPGPVHLNLPFREPLTPIEEDAAAIRRVAAHLGGPSSPPRPRAETGVHPAAFAGARAALDGATRAWIVAGPRAARSAEERSSILALAEARGAPVVADIASGLRFERHDAIVRCADALLRAEGAERPDLVIRVGGYPTSKCLNQFLALHRPRCIAVQEHRRRIDPDGIVTDVIEGGVAEFCHALLSGPRAAPSRLLADAVRCRTYFDTTRLPLEASALVHAAGALPEHAILFLSNSMPVRWGETYLDRAPAGIDVHVSRGVNGIDGIASTALGVARGSNRPVLLVEGDIAFLHDLGGWIAAREIGAPFAALVLNNGGGGIFAHLPISGFPEVYGPYFHTPHHLDIEAAARALGLEYARATTAEDCGAHVAATMERGGVRVIEIATDAVRMATEHRAVLAGLQRLLESER